MRKRLAIAGAIAVVACALGAAGMRLWPSEVAAAGPAPFASLAVDGLRIPRARSDEDAVDVGETTVVAPTHGVARRGVVVTPEDVSPESLAQQGFANTSDYDREAGALPTTIEEWQPPGPRRCERRGRRRYCDGPLHAPAPHGEAAARAARLGLGSRSAWFRALSVEEPEAAWLATIPARTDASNDLLWPVAEGFLGRRFGQHLHGDPDATPHPGIDIPAAAGADIRAADDGLVLYADNGRHGYGNVVMLLHRTGHVTVYAHCSVLYVFAGQLVERGASIGEVGKTGLAHGNHLHFEWRRRGHARSPLRRLVGRPDHEAEVRLANEQRARRREAEARLAEVRARAERNAARRARRHAREAAR